MDDAPFVPVGRIVKVHGLNGEVSVAVVPDPSLVIPVGLSVWVVPPSTGPSEFTVESVRRGPKGPLVKLATVACRADAEPLRGRTLLARPQDLPAEWSETPRDDVGFVVIDVHRGTLGEIVDVIQTGANDVWVVEGERYGQVLIPVIDDVVVCVDEVGRVATVDLLPGLIEEQDEGA